MNFIKKKIKYYSSWTIKWIIVAFVALSIITLLIATKFNVVYNVKLDGKEIGMVKDKNEIENKVDENINSPQAPVTKATIDQKPEYDLAFVAKPQAEDESGNVWNEIDKHIDKKYKFYAIKVGDKQVAQLVKKEDAETVLDQLKKERDFSKAEIEEKETNVNHSEDFETAKKLAFDTAISIQDAEQKQAEIQRQKALEYRRLALTSRSLEASRGDGQIQGLNFICPLVNKRFSARYLGYPGHRGTDLVTPIGTPVRAAEAGTVITVRDQGNTSYGRYVVIDHGNGITTLYAHNSNIGIVHVGQQVVKGQTIALSGSTGNSTGPHVHFEIRINGRQINPEPYI